jgi:hypothetical protein
MHAFVGYISVKDDRSNQSDEEKCCRCDRFGYARLYGNGGRWRPQKKHRINRLPRGFHLFTRPMTRERLNGTVTPCLSSN